MTPQERQLMAELFDRLATLENAPRDPDAEAMIREGFRRAPNAAYALVQTVLVQDEALKAANNRIQQYEQQADAPQPEQPRGFLDSMRDSLFGREEPRGSVPRVPQGGAPSGAPMGAPPGYGGDPWAARARGISKVISRAPRCSRPAPQQGGGGSSFLGTAAAAAAGMIGGSLLMGGIRSAMAGHQGGAGLEGVRRPRRGRRRVRPGAAGGGGDLAREAGLDDIRGGRSGSGSGMTTQARRACSTARRTRAKMTRDYDDSGDDGDFDGGDTEET